ncbi:hypothetical protein PYCCODRAFT_1471947 [Trametes coccinea BRFM310]|uniref:Uncharacterized protein n=1 Tax=Trametes coccinea (strain BRFM310) TaxID=1353009 RepID=A0A1Y2I886_TRAC3|nr:hypothetical protein PYCCODRAFT_1471947 [Trametes coccinea BRFM310]
MSLSFRAVSTTTTLHQSCRICTHALSDTYLRDESANDSYAGEVFSIEESIFTPIEHILADPEVSGLKGEALNTSRASLASFCTREHATYKLRPCILMDTWVDRPFGEVIQPLICLMATFENTPFTHLPRILRYFSILVYPNLVRLTPDILNHIHSLPPWPTFKTDRYQLIVAWPFRTTRKLLDRWLTPAAKTLRSSRPAISTPGLDREPHSGASTSQRRGMAFGKYAMRQLRNACSTLRSEWMRKCQEDVNFAAEHEAEYRAWQKARKDELAEPEFSWGGDSVRSQASAARRKKAPPSRYSKSVLSMPIIEGQESEFHTKLSVDGIVTPQRATIASRRQYHPMKTSSLRSASSRLVHGAGSEEEFFPISLLRVCYKCKW